MPERMTGMPARNTIERLLAEKYKTSNFKKGIIIIREPATTKRMPPVNCHIHAIKRKISNIIVGL